MMIPSNIYTENHLKLLLKFTQALQWFCGMNINNVHTVQENKADRLLSIAMGTSWWTALENLASFSLCAKRQPGKILTPELMAQGNDHHVASEIVTYEHPNDKSRESA